MPAPAQVPAAPSSQRPFRINDWFAQESVDDITFAPDGQAVAFVRTRAANSQVTTTIVIEETRRDVWLQEAPGRPVRNLTRGQADSSGWWSPQWSPDGQRLAMLSSRGGTITLWLWERATDRVRQLSPQDVEFRLGGGYRWIDAHRLVAVGLPRGERATLMGGNYIVPGSHAQMAMDAWAKALRGEVTASAIHSLEFKQPQRRLLLIDVGTGSSREIAPTQWQDAFTVMDIWWLSPGGRAVAVRRPLPAKYPAVERVVLLRSPASLELRWIDGRPVRLNRPLPENVATMTLRWSPDGKSLAFFAWGEAPIHPLLLHPEGASDVVQSPEERAAPLLKNPARLWRVDLEGGRVTEWDMGDIDLDVSPQVLAAWLHPDRRQGGSRGSPLELPAFEWTSNGELLFHAARRMQSSDQSEPEVEDSPGPREWVVLSPDGRTRPGAERLKAGFVADSLAEVARQRFERAVKPPAPGAQLAALSAASASGIYSGASSTGKSRNGTFLWRVASSGTVEPLVAANTFLKDVAYGQPKLIDYTTLNGEPMKAFVFLPPGYKRGRRYPLVVDSDVGYTGDIAEGMHVKAQSGNADFEALAFAAGGYVYMFASMPTRNTMDAAGRANLLLLAHGLVPAVDKVIELGYADPERLFLYGQSSMGYGVYGLVTQTRRFKAAVAQCGWTDQITESLLTRGVVARYADWRFDMVGFGAPYTSHVLPVWRNADQLRRNSPLSYVDRVQTPLMIVHGDLDLIPMTTPEMFFAALVQQRKPAQFVRYWGEGHGILNPRNVADQYQRMFAWFDEWGDISRDAKGDIVYDGNRVKARGDAPMLRPEDYARFAVFGPGGDKAKVEEQQSKASR